MEKLLLQFIESLDKAFKQQIEQHSAELGLDNLAYSQIKYIETIHQLENPTVSEIAEKLNLSRASVSTAVQIMEKQGYLIKYQSQNDKRSYTIQLTEKSSSIIALKMKALFSYKAYIQSRLNKTELIQFQKCLEKLI